MASNQDSRAKSLDADLPRDAGDTDRLLGDVANEFFGRISQGERPSVEEYAQRYPQIAELIRDTFGMVDLLVDPPGDVVAVKSPSASLSSRQQLGDFRIAQELGRGGMGVVYEAEQLSLGRKVALKVLPFAAAIDKRALTRFQNEARAAGTLEHPNIVPVYGVGEERGVHYYAMRMIEGRSVAEVIAEMRETDGEQLRSGQFTLRADSLAGNVVKTHSSGRGKVRATDRPRGSSSASRRTAQESTVALNALSTLRLSNRDRYFVVIAELGIQIAEALQHSHENGIVHRDVKPGNILIDDDGKAWITDFGLARLAADATVTLTGDIVGTLRYMAPEQADPHGVGADQRVDVYSLGATLYELVTLQPAFDGAGREELMRQLSCEEVKPLRHFQKHLPVDLETIILKAISRNPLDRYVTAQQMADDLRAFAEDEPIKAKRPSILDRSRNWARRHKVLVSAAALILIVAALGLGGVAIAVAVGKSRTEAALKTAKANLQESERQRKRAEDNVRLAIDTIDELYTDFATDLLAQESATTTVQQEFLDRSIRFYERILNSDDGEHLQPELTSLAQERIGEIRIYLQDYAESVEPLQQAVAGARQLMLDFPHDKQHHEAFVRSCRMLCESLLQLARFDEAQSVNASALEVGEQLALAAPHSMQRQFQLAECRLDQIWVLVMQAQLPRAERLARQLRQHERELRGTHTESSQRNFFFSLQCDHVLADILLRLDQPKESRHVCTTAISQCSEMRKSFLSDAQPVLRLEADLLQQLGDIARSEGKFEQAVDHYRAALELAQRGLKARRRPELVFGMIQNDEFVPDGNIEPGPFCDFVETQLKLVDALRQAERPYEAEQLLGEAMAVAWDIAMIRPNSLRFQVAHANSFALAALLVRAANADSRALLTYAAKVWDDALVQFPHAAAFHSDVHSPIDDLAWFRRTFPNALDRANHVDRQAARSAVFNSPFLLRSVPGLVYRSGEYESAARMFQELEHRGSSSPSLNQLHLALCQAKLGRLDEAERCIEIARKLAQQDPGSAGKEFLMYEDSAETALLDAEKTKSRTSRGSYEFVGQLADKRDEELGRPRGVAVGPHRRVYVANNLKESVLRFDYAKGRRAIHFVHPGLGGLENPIDLLIYGMELLVSDIKSSDLLRYDAYNGDYRGVLRAPDTWRLRDLALNAENELFAIEKLNRVVKYDATDQEFKVFVESRPGEQGDLLGIAFGPDGHLYVGSRDTNSILRFDGNTGEFIETFLTGHKDVLARPVSLAFHTDGRLYVASQDNDAVLRYDASNGKFIDAAVSSGYGGLDVPRDFAFDGNDLIVTGRLSGIYRYRLRDRKPRTEETDAETITYR